MVTAELNARTHGDLMLTKEPVWRLGLLQIHRPVTLPDFCLQNFNVFENGSQ